MRNGNPEEVRSELVVFDMELTNNHEEFSKVEHE